MKSIRSLITVLLISGCAGGGGGPSGGIQVPPAINDDHLTEGERQCLRTAVGFAQLFCLAGRVGGGSPSAPSFTSWSQFPRDSGYLAPKIDAVSMKTDYTSAASNIATVSAASIAGTASLAVDYDAAGRGQLLFIAHLDGTYLSLSKLAGDSFVNLSAIGQGGLEFAQQSGTFSSTNPFTAVASSGIALAANPFVLGWEYQSFGVWNSDSASPSWVRAASFGAPTAASAVPLSGDATFSGKLGGLYVSPGGLGSLAFADLTVAANFSARTLGISSTATATTRNLLTSTAAPHLNLSGTLTYAPGANNFSGTLTNAGGTMSGQSSGRYYGPAAQELGGVFTLRSASTVETFTGGYGAKR